MHTVWLYAVLSVILESLVSLFGVLTLPFTGERLKGTTSVLVSLAVGAMLGDAFIHLLPEAFAKTGNPLQVSLCVLAGIFGFFALEKFLHWHHVHSLDEHDHGEGAPVHPVGYMSLIAGGLDNLVDGLVIGAAFLISVSTGIAVTIAIVLHEIPKEMGEFGVLIHAGFSRPKAILYNCMTALLSVTGTVISLILGGTIANFATLVAPFAAGIFIYIAGSDLVPQLHRELKPSRSAVQLLVMAAGVAAMVLVKVLE